MIKLVEGFPPFILFKVLFSLFANSSTLSLELFSDDGFLYMHVK